MKYLKSFGAFLDDEVNLNQGRVDKANQTFDTLTSFLQNAAQTKDLFIETSRQGSLRQGTIIKPRADDAEFDVDMLLLMNVIPDAKPVEYLGKVKAAFEASDRYKDMLLSPAPSRCETIDYAGDFHVDVVPAIESDGKTWIMNRTTNQYEPTDGDGYAQWFAKRNKATGGQLVRVVRLAKYLRDEHDLPIKSILLTTMLANCVQDTDTTALYPDVPTSLKLLLDRWDTWLQSQATTPKVSNPALPSETFDRHWNATTFASVKAAVHDLAGVVRTAYDSADEEASAEGWKKAFGECFPILDEDLKTGAVVAAATLALGSAAHARPVTDIAPRGEALAYRVQIEATLHSRSGKMSFRGISSKTKVASDLSIRFRGRTLTPEPFDVFWQVVNTGSHAASEANGLRGDFRKGRDLQNRPTNKLLNWELTKYTGVHWIECFIVKDQTVVARDRFYIGVKNPGV